MNLAELGFPKNCILETIVSTYSDETKPHAAPMGVSTIDGETLLIKPYKTTQTYGNLVSMGCAVINVTSDPVLFYRSLFREGLRFRKAVMVEAPALVDADGWVEVEVGQWRDLGDERVVFSCLVRGAELRDVVARPYSRAVHAVMESVIHSTRIPIFLKTERRGEALRLVELVRWYKSIVERVAPATVYAEIMDRLDSRISEWLRGYEDKSQDAL
ncbi:MAG: DUF447 family protein [Nitrososphaerota archaeon]